MSDLDYSTLFALAGTGKGLDPAQLEQLNARDVGLSAHLGIRYTELADGRVRAELEVGPHLLQPAGIVNGGVFCALAESVGSLAGVAAAGAPVVGANNDTDFIAAVREGIIHAEATPIQVGGRTQLWEILMHNDERLVARSTLRTMVMKR
ncbi:MAG: PaaI family thioesterase [Corynebacterium sp.]|uniref:PaaI family thioesterase n=1 Tax=Corynebacterium sp. TaxID=1720 RepID=UPI0026E00532|nr:PaaI family thioesterase [Corynebacterium sp.]MDO5670582.1 PaaI family thioesterase [Corynebacterium sp.]